MSYLNLLKGAYAIFHYSLTLGRPLGRTESWSFWIGIENGLDHAVRVSSCRQSSSQKYLQMHKNYTYFEDTNSSGDRSILPHSYHHRTRSPLSTRRPEKPGHRRPASRRSPCPSSRCQFLCPLPDYLREWWGVRLSFEWFHIIESRWYGWGLLLEHYHKSMPST